MGWDPLANPCPWWSPRTEVEHRTWLATPVPDPVPWVELDPCRTWPAGQTVILITQGTKHLAYVRLEGFTFSPRWLPGSIADRRVSPAALTTRDPRQVWSDAYELQLAKALLSAYGDPRCAWLRDIDEATEPELFDLLLTARGELARPVTPTTEPVHAPASEPRPRRAWLRADVDAMRGLDQYVEAVDLAPGR